MDEKQIKIITEIHGIHHQNNFGFHYDEIKNKSWFKTNFKPISYSFDHLNNKILDVIEHKKHPIHGIQFHPEYSKNTKFVYQCFESLLRKSKQKIEKSVSEPIYKIEKKDNYLIFS